MRASLSHTKTASCCEKSTHNIILHWNKINGFVNLFDVSNYRRGPIIVDKYFWQRKNQTYIFMIFLKSNVLSNAYSDILINETILIMSYVICS